MAKTRFTITDVQHYLGVLGYYDGDVDGDAMGSEWRTDLRRFQRDYPRECGGADGWYGPKTERALLPLAQMIDRMANEWPGEIGSDHFRRFRMTYYYLGTDIGKGGAKTVPMVDPEGKLLSMVTAGTFIEAALEGTTHLRDGRILNVAGKPRYRKCDPAVFALVFARAKKNGWIPEKAGYAGIRTDGRQATHARTFAVRKPGPNGWPVERGKIEMDPFRTIATDTGRLRRHDPKFKKRGGVIPVGTKVFILELVGMKLPDNTIHDGWCVANDTGGGIFGAHIDLFTGYKAWAKATIVPRLDLCHLWFEGIDERIPMDYSYGLR